MRGALPLVDYLVSEVVARVPRSVPREDLASAAMLGLAQAARNWDPERGVPFDRYARLRIRGAILDELRHRDWASRSVRADGRRYRNAVDKLTAELGRPPVGSEVADRLGVDMRWVEGLRDDLARASLLSVESLVEVTDDEPPASGDGPDTKLLGRELKVVLGDAVAALPDRLRKVVIEYFFDERPMQAIAEDLGVTESRVSQMTAEALALLRDGINAVLDPELVPDRHVTSGRVGRRKAAYYAAIANASTAQDRIAADVSVPERVATLLARSA